MRALAAAMVACRASALTGSNSPDFVVRAAFSDLPTKQLLILLPWHTLSRSGIDSIRQHSGALTRLLSLCRQ